MSSPTPEALRAWVARHADEARERQAHWRAAYDDGSSIAGFMLSQSDLPMWEALLALQDTPPARDDAPVCKCGTEMVCPDIGCDANLAGGR